VISETAIAHKYMREYYTLHIPPTCFVHSYGHLCGGELHRVHNIEILQKFLTNDRYEV